MKSPRLLLLALTLSLAALAATPPKAEPPRWVSYPEFNYPGTLIGSLGRGVVQVLLVVGADGRVVKTEVQVATHPDFAFSAISTLRNCKFHPATSNGQPVQSVYYQNIVFDVIANGQSIGDSSFGFRPVPSKKSPPEFQYENAATILATVNPVYPYELALAGITGRAEVELVVGARSGLVTKTVTTTATHPEFGEALEAMVVACEMFPANAKGYATPSLLRRRQRFGAGAETLTFDRQTKQLIKELKSPAPKIVDGSQLAAPLSPIYRPPFNRGALSKWKTGGSAVIEFFVDHTGQAQLPRVVEASDRAFGWAAATVVQQWIFERPVVNGQPAFVRLRVPLRIEAQK